MAYDGNEDQNRRMDLNLYLGLPRSPRRAESDLGSDLALGSLPIPGEGEIQGSTEMSGYADASDSHAPYSPSHASYSPNPQTVEPLDPNENSPFEYSDYSPQPPYPTVTLSIDPSDEPLVHEGRSHLEYNPYSPSYNSPSYIPVSPIVEAGLEPQSDDVIDPIDHAPYSPIYVPASNLEHDGETLDHEDSNHIEYVPYSPSFVPASFSPPREPDEPLIQDNDPPYIPNIPTTEVHSDALHEGMGFVAYQAATQTREAFRRELLQCPQVRFRRLIESTRRWRLRRFRSSIPYRFGPDLGAFSSGSHPFDDETPVERSPEAHCGAQKTTLEGHAAEDLEEEKEQGSVGANFDCNICLDVAKEPVVTSCGHLFCWPCIYQWLHLHCDHKECPVCKGEVNESKLIPIYGRGSSEKESDKKGQEDGDSGLKVPPRPRGQRFESLRQRIRRPHLRRSVEERGSRRVIQGEEPQNENRVDRQGEPVLHGVFDAANRRTITRLMEVQRLQRTDSQRAESLQSVLNFWGSGPSRNATELDSDHARVGISPPNPFHGGGPLSSSPGLSRHGISFWPQHAFFSSTSTSTDRLAAIAADVSSVRMGNSGNHSGASTSASPRVTNVVNVQGPREAVVAADQASASSTMAVIQDDAGLPVDAPAEPNSVGSSHAPRRRRRNSVAGSLDVDGGVHQARKRRRIN
ncbi:uncharacterized protein LOC122646047 [Telopea speciosissima]|uniref:uncharacterized protein LOC122646047 n=1 Tax=Telopea speciosissima TaxID=54955 RepID=UPI001CC7B624|nr:uncharacterized protein LOC122646047 [Telopea speciosissima]